MAVVKGDTAPDRAKFALGGAFTGFSTIKVNFGIAIAARVAKIATTIISSMRVKPLALNGFFTGPSLSGERLTTHLI